MGSNAARLRRSTSPALWNCELPHPAKQGETVRILIADDHTMFREGLRALLEGTPGYVVVGEASDGDEVLQLAREQMPDLILLDLDMPRQDGMQVLRALAGSLTDAKTMVLTASINQTETLEALQLGARGVLLKSESGRVLFESMRRVMAGEYWLGPEGMVGLVEAVRTVSRQTGVPGARFSLTPRETEIISSVVAGYSNQEIAERRGISEQTVKHHLTNIFDKLGVFSRLELALFAVNHHLAGRVI